MVKVIVGIIFLPVTLLSKLANSIRDAAGVSDREVITTDVLVDPNKGE